MNWPEYEMSNLVRQFISGGTPSTTVREYWEGEIPWITGADIEDGEVILGRRYINEAAVRNSATNIVPRGSILMVTRTGVGKLAIAPVDIAISQDFTGIVLREGLDVKFVLTAIRSRIGFLLAVQRGATIKGVTRDDVKSLSIPLPSLSEQRRIVEILDRADTLRKKRAEADAKATRILPALFYRMFGDTATNPKRWSMRSLGEVTQNTRNGLYKPSEFCGSGVGILKMFNIQNGELDLTRIDLIDVTDDEFVAFRLNPGDILINRVNTPELVGKCAVITEEVGKAVFESKNIRLRVRKDLVTPEFVASYLNSQFGHGALRVGVKHAIGMATLNNTDLRNTRIPVPPLALQNQWSDIFCQIRFLRKMRTDSLGMIVSLFQNLLHRAFTGDLTTKWREAHRTELLVEMEQQARSLN